MNDEMTGPTPLLNRNELHYDRRVWERVDWSERGSYMERKHGITPPLADEALGDASRVLIDPDYNSTSGRSTRIIGYSVSVGDIITVIVLEDDGTEYGVNGWVANEKDRRIYNDANYYKVEGEADEQEDN